jgi:tape measure domain-containing protein
MSGGGVEFSFSLLDRASGPANRIAGSLNRADGGLHRLDASSRRMDAAMGGAASSSAALSAGLVGLAVAAGAAAVGVIKLGVGLASQFVEKVFETASALEVLQIAFKNITGSSGRGNIEIEKGLALADRLGTNAMDTLEGLRGLIAKGFSSNMATDLVGVAADLKTVGATSEQMKGAIRVIGQIKDTGKLQGDELNELANAGVAPTKVFEQLAKSMGKTVPEIIKMKEQGKITAEQTIPAIMSAIKQMTGGKSPGVAAAEAANNSVTGMLERLKNAPTRLFIQIAKGLEDSFKGFLPMLREIVAFLDPKNPTMAKILTEVQGALRGIGEAIITAWPFLKEFLKGFGEGFGAGWEVLKEMGKTLAKAFGGGNLGTLKEWTPALQMMGKALAHLVMITTVFLGVVSAVITVGAALLAWPLLLAAAIATLDFEGLADRFKRGNQVMEESARGFFDRFVQGNRIFLASLQESAAGAGAWAMDIINSVIGLGATLVNQIATVGSTVFQSALALGRGIIDGMVSGITSGITRVADAVKQAALGAIGAGETTLKTGSPSKEFEWLGKMTSLGMAQGVNDNAFEPQAAVTSMVAPPAASGAQLGGRVTISVNVTVIGGDSAQETGEAVGRAVRLELESAFEQLAREVAA